MVELVPPVGAFEGVARLGCSDAQLHMGRRCRPIFIWELPERELATRQRKEKGGRSRLEEGLSRRN
jgi:hypothetical protein